MRRLIFGCGYLGKRVGQLWSKHGAAITVVTRKPERRSEFAALGWETIVADITDPQSLDDLPPAESILFAVGYDRQSGSAIRDVYAGGLRNVLQRLTATPQSFLYISSTGVYGHEGGEWVNESSACCPWTPGGRACLECEELLSASGVADRVAVLRLAGIYGPGRIPRQTELQRGEPLAVAAEAYLNLIHVDDGAAVAVAVADRDHTVKCLQPADSLLTNRKPSGSVAVGELFNVSDGCPVRRSEFYRYLAQLNGWPEPMFVPVDPTSSSGERARSDKRIDSQRLRREIPRAWLYPTYREGLAAIVARGDDN